MNLNLSRQLSEQISDFPTTVSFYHADGGLCANIGSPWLLICDEEIWTLLPKLLPAFAGSLADLPLLRPEEDLPDFAGILDDSLSQGGDSSLPRGVVILPRGEAAKTMGMLEFILRSAFALGLARDSAFLALGGGAVCDVAAFASSIFMRGNRLILIPSTLLAMVDASFGGKTGINYFGYKNMVGSIYPAAEPANLSRPAAYPAPAGVHCRACRGY